MTRAQIFIYFLSLCFVFQACPSYSQELSSFGLPALVAESSAGGKTEYSLSLQILALMTALTVLPSLVLGMTAFTRIIIVLSILRQALGTIANPSKSGLNRNCIVPNILHYEPNI